MAEYTIDAAKKSVGRVASEAAMFLMGKTTPGYKRNAVPDAVVTITNASHMVLHGRKADQQTHKRYSGFPGGLTITPWREVVEKKGYGELVRVAVSGMLPKNKLRAKMLKHLVVKE